MDSSIGDTFNSFEELDEKIKTFEKNAFVKLWRRDSRTIERALRIAPKRQFNEALKYTAVTYNCIHGGRKIKSLNRSTL